MLERARGAEEALEVIVLRELEGHGAVGFATGEFEHADYYEFLWAKQFKPWERLPLRHEFDIRWEDRPDGSSDVVWLNRVVADLYLTKYMWVKASIQNQDDGIHNYSLIYTWKLKYNTYVYLVYNDVDEGEEPSRSVLAKVTYTFR